MILICIGTVTCFAQKKGYDIRVVFEENKIQEDQSLYLTGFYGDDNTTLDSCRVKKGTARFKSGALLPDGYYLITDKKEWRDYPPVNISIVVEQNRKFTVTPDAVTGSVENQTFRNFMTNAFSLMRSVPQIRTHWFPNI